MLGSEAKIEWKQEAQALVIKCPEAMPFKIVVGFRVE